MAAKVFIPTPLRPYVGGGDMVLVEGGTVSEALADLVAKHGELRKHLYAEDGRLRTFVNVYVNDEDIRYKDGDKTRLADGDSISIVPSIAGGAGAGNGAPGAVPGLAGRAAALALSNEEALRYSRHLILPEVGVDGQKRLKAARVLLIGAGGLGSPLGLYLAAAGVGTIGIVDFDVVDSTNLQRQIIHGTSDVGRPKLHSARDRLRDVNPNVDVQLYEIRLSSENALELFRDYDMVIDGTDNFPTRYLVNDACVLTGKPNVYGSIFRFEGQASVFATAEGPCYRCLYAEPPPPGLVPSCAEGGVLGVLCASIGSIQVTEAIKVITGIGEPLVGRLMVYDALEMAYRKIKVRKDPNCAVCGENPTVTSLIDYEDFCGAVSDEASAAVVGSTISVNDLDEWMKSEKPIHLVDVREPAEYEIVKIPGSILIPKGDILSGQALASLPQDRQIVLYCKTGVRSAEALAAVKAAGFRDAVHVHGGVSAWVRQVDPSQPSY
jgi:sulfur-carrier protein adenylyltransferase/sulfurtransferase